MTVREELLALLLEEEGIESPEAAIPRAAEEGDPPLSFAQRRLWFLDQMDPGNPMYNMPFALGLRGPLSVPALERSLTEIVRRHEALRSIFPSADGEPAQVVRAAGPQPLQLVDLRGAGDSGAGLDAVIEDEVHHAFDLAVGPLLRTSLVALEDDHHVLVANMHHIVSDGWSMGVFTRELVALYSAFAADEDSPLAPLPIRYSDFARWQQDRLRGERLEDLLGYWRDALAGAPPRLELPADRPRPPRQSFRGALHTFHLPPSLADDLRDLSRRQGVTLFMSLLAAFQTLLHRWSGEEHVVVASSIANRTRTEVEGLIGFFVNMLPLHGDLSGDPAFLDLVESVRRVTLAGYDHQELPFDRLVEELEPERDLSYNPLCQVFFALQEPPPSLELPGLAVELLDVGRTTARYDLYLDVHQEAGGGLEGRIEYATDLFEASTVERFARQYRTLLEGIVADPRQRLSRLPLLGEDERGEAALASRGRRADAGERGLAELFEAQVERRPGDTAAACGEASITYRELDRRANRLANRLRALGVEPEVPVGVMLERSLDSLVALLGVLKAGGVYLPLDPEAPAAHRAFVLRDAGAGLLVTCDALQARWPEHGVAVLSLDDECLAAESAAGPATPAALDQLALIAYTSGSTGVPKGVAVPQRQLVNRFAWMWRDFPFEPGEVACQRAAPSFSVSLWEFLGPLLQGAPVAILPDAAVKDGPRLAAALAEHRVTRIVLVPSLLRMLLESGADLSRLGGLRWWSVCGEVLAPELCRLFFERLPHARLLHQYGASELNDAAFCEVPRTPELGERVPIGRPIANTELHVLDRHLEPAPAGVPGELCAAGPGLARGYRGRAAATAAAFVPHPSSCSSGERLYRTGDRGRRLAGGALEVLGRRDQRVKVRGIRVELGGIEAVLRRHPGVRQAAVVAREHAGETQLVAYVAPTPERSPTVGGHERYPLPNGMAVVHLNRNETDFLYDELFVGHTYLKHGITFEDGDVVFDVGANIGLFSLFAHTRCKNPKIFAFEPNPTAFEALGLNASLYGLDAELCDYGLSTEEGTARFTFYPKFTFMSGLYGDPDQEKANVRSFLRKQGEEAAGSDGLIEELLADRFEARELEVRLETLSQVLRRHRVERVDLLKVNVEKAELDVLLGVEPEDWPRIRQVVLQVHNVDGRLERVTDLLRTHGFELTTMRDWAVEADQDVHYVYATRGRRGASEPGRTPCAPTPAAAPFLESDELRRYLRDRLPEAMVPARFVLSENLPATASGKVDRRRLPEPGRDASGAGYVAPRDADEESLAGIVREVLDVERVGVFDSFFDLGGHSLLATRVMARVQQAFAVDLPLPALFEQPTVAGLAAAVRRARERQEEADVLEVLARVEGLSDDQTRAALGDGAGL